MEGWEVDEIYYLAMFEGGIKVEDILDTGGLLLE